MRLLSPVRIVLIGAIVLAGLFSAGLAQTTPGIPADSVPTITTGLAHENVGAGGLASRSPGNMVNAGVASAQNAVKFGRTTAATITATAQPGPFDLFLAGAVDMILNAIKDLLLYFQDLFLARAGLPPIDSNSNTNGNDNSNTNDNANGNDNSNGTDNSNENGNTNANSNLNSNQNDNSSGTGRPGGVRKLRW